MTSHNCLQLSPIFHKIHMVKDKNFIKFELSAKWWNKTLYFRFLNLGPKAKL
jgi:hypothetical protein